MGERQRAPSSGVGSHHRHPLGRDRWPSRLPGLTPPLLRFAGDGEIHTGAEAVDHIAWLYKLAPEDRAQLLPSGRTRTLNNRTHWALTYLRHAGLLGSEGHGKFRITERGRILLKANPAKIDKALLAERYPEIVDFIGGKSKTSSATPNRGPSTRLSRFSRPRSKWRRRIGLCAANLRVRCSRG